MKLFKFNSRKYLVLILTLVVSLMMVGCGNKKEVLEEINSAISSITLGDVTTLKDSFDIRNTTNVGDLEIKWELVDADTTLKLEAKNVDWTTVVVTPTEYTEDAQGKQTNVWGKGTLRATVTKEEQSVSRDWTLNVVPGEKTNVLTVEGIKNSDEDTAVEITGIVRYIVSGKGFYVEDTTGAIYVFQDGALADGVVPGAKVNVKGKKVLYYGMPQVTEPVVSIVAAAPTTGYDYSKAPAVEIGDINKLTTTDLEAYGKIAKISGMVVRDYKSPTNGQTVSQFAIIDSLTNETAAIYNSSSQAVKDLLATKVGDYVSIVIVINDFHSSQKVWRHYGIEGSIQDIEAPVLTDAEIIANAKAEVELQLKDKSFAADLDLPTSGIAGGTITWVSGNTAVVANDGKVTIPAVDTDVELTYTITSGETSTEYKVTVKILAVTLKTVKEATDVLDTADGMVMVEGVIIGQDVDGYYYLADETGVIYVRHKLADNTLVVGNKVKVTGNGLVFLNTNKQYTRQISGNYSVVKVDDQIHTSPLAAVDATIADFDFTIKGEELRTKVPQELLYGKVVKFNAFITIQGSYNNVYLATSTEAGAPKILVYYKSMGDADLRALAGKQVTITAVVYDYNVADGWRLGFLNREGDLAFELTEAEKLAIAKDEIEAVVTNDKAVGGDLGFFTDAKSSLISTTKYTWESNNVAVIANDGKFTAPTADTDVIITVKVFLDGNVEGTASATHTYTVKAKAPVAVVGGVMISQAYGGGGNSGATLKSDFIELYNSSDQDIDITGWVVFYASATGLFKAIGSESYQTGYLLTGTIKAKSFFLIKGANGAGGTEDLPTPDATSELGLGGSSFKLALCNTNVIPTDANSTNVVDFVGAASNANFYEGAGPAPAPSNTLAIVRATLKDTNDNAADFTAAAPAPRNSAYIPA